MRVDNGKHNGRKPIARQLYLSLNTALVVILGLSMAWDVHTTRKTLLWQKLNDLHDDAITLLPSVEERTEKNAAGIQPLLNQICEGVRDADSPDHHITVRIGSAVVRSSVVHTAPQEDLGILERAVQDPQGIARTARGDIICTKASSGPTVVYISESLGVIEQIIRAEILSRLAVILGTGLALALVLNIVLHRWLVQPVKGMASVVRRFAGGEHGVQMEAPNSAELGLMADEFNQMSATIKRTEEAHEFVLRKARRIQQSLRPDMQNVPSVRLARLFEPAADVAGDYFDALVTSHGGVIFCVADVSGHDIAAAMSAAMIKGLLQEAVEHESDPDPQKLLAHINVAFSRVCLEEDFATIFLAHWDPAGGALRYASAGHEPAYIMRAADGLETLLASGPPVGTVASWQGQTATIQVSAGDWLIIPTDGIAETMSPAEVQFGRERLVAVLREGREGPIEELPDKVLHAVKAHRQHAPQTDDLTLLAVEF